MITPDEAIGAYEATVRTYAAGKQGKLYWRCEPHLDEHKGQYRVLSRMVIG